MKVGEINTPALLVDSNVFTENISHMSAARPGTSLRPHVKAFKSSYLAKELVAAGHENFCCATIREMEGMVAAGLGKDLLLANQTLNSERLKKLIDGGSARVTVAVDSEETIQAAKIGGVSEVLIDVDVGMPRCGCHPNEAGELAEKARAAGLKVRGVMGYEGHLMHQKDQQKRDMGMERSIKKLETASWGVDITGDCRATELKLEDGNYLSIGSGNDLRLRHDGTNSTIVNSTGSLKILGS